MGTVNSGLRLRADGGGLVVRGLVAAHRRRGKAILEGIDLEVRPGEVVGILGPNGCGKSTLLKTLCGIIKPRTGSMMADGIDLTAMRPSKRAKLIGYVPQQDEGVGGALTVGESLSLGLNRRALGDAAVRDIVLDITNRLGLDGMVMRRAVELSGGQRQRVLIGRALAMRTPYLLLDEPVSSLDLRYQLEILEILTELAGVDDAGVLVVLHDLNLAVAYCDRLIVLDGGAVVAAGEARSVVTTELVEQLYGPVATVVDIAESRFVLPERRRADTLD